MRLGEKFKDEFKWHFLTAFLMLIVIEIFNDRFQPIIPTIIALPIGTFLLGLCLFLIDGFVGYLFNGLKRIRGFLCGGVEMKRRSIPRSKRENHVSSKRNG